MVKHWTLFHHDKALSTRIEKLKLSSLAHMHSLRFENLLEKIAILISWVFHYANIIRYMLQAEIVRREE